MSRITTFSEHLVQCSRSLCAGAVFQEETPRWWLTFTKLDSPYQRPQSSENVAKSGNKDSAIRGEHSHHCADGTHTSLICGFENVGKIHCEDPRALKGRSFS